MKNGFFLVLSLILVGIVIFMMSPIFGQKELIITGNKNLSCEEIKELTDFRLDKNIFLFDYFGTRERLLKNSFIDKVKIKYDLPDKILIDIKERKAECYLKYLSDVYVLIDNENRVLEINKTREKDFPVVIGLKFDYFCLGEKLRIRDKKWIKNVIELCEYILESGINLDDFVIDLKKIDDVHVYIKDIDIMLGDIILDCDYKIALLKSILDSESEYLKKPGILDLRDKDQAPVFEFIT